MRALVFDVKKADVLLRNYDREEPGKISYGDFNEVSKYKIYKELRLQ